MFDRRKARWAGVNPHDRLVLDQGEPKKLKGDILHYSYYTVRDHLKQVEYFTDIAAKANFEKGVRGSWAKKVFGGLFKFIHSYFIKLGILDGYYGLVVSAISARATYLKYHKLSKLGK
jgi:hypothetical protein